MVFSTNVVGRIELETIILYIKMTQTMAVYYSIVEFSRAPIIDTRTGNNKINFSPVQRWNVKL